mmetsp:Transcript_34640/g.56056  ORF Transcript_34640/g.56056 Transcript_34640/m.56056 type:complete len:238 (-) Transcript_34640:177-890(-)|eukprot:CAMPEP_0184664350 /NCGR_PEP_ID=MMETSP0308-20130426/52371_1 /TAXON_ID=38269 /ORGANISM="Gloeochaete witrockiana, Strain SAG 46.84" /LENGTH=237 /DNA_ID=CAMNT_0027107685 /DNA_START=66 /DNA_END=779 /DNA_ORIENTATION=+
MTIEKQQAHAPNQFSTPTYVTIGDPYEKKAAADARFVGKQFATAPLKQGDTPETLFEKAYLWLHENKAFDDSWAYRLRQKEKKKGFGSGDFKKRDEFTEHFRSEQYKERLRHENHLLRKIGEQQKAYTDDCLGLTSADRPMTSNGDSFYACPRFTFDVITSQSQVKSCQKCARDKHFCPHRRPVTSLDNPIASMNTTNGGYGYGISERLHEKAEYARIPIVREQFWHRTLGNIIGKD